MTNATQTTAAATTTPGAALRFSVRVSRNMRGELEAETVHHLDSEGKPGAFSITLTRGEGPSSECGQPVTVDSFAEANAVLHSWSETAPKTGGYDKCDFVIHWADGGTYDGRYELKHHSAEPANLTGHMVDLAEFYTGKNCPAHMSAAAYAQHMERTDEGTQAAYAEVLATMATMGEYTPKVRPISMDLRALIASGIPFAGLVGLGVTYCGDRFNDDGVGAIVSAEPCQWAGVRVVVHLEDGRVQQATAANFGDKAGDRYRLDWKTHGAPYLAQLAAAVAAKKANTSSAREMEKQAHAKALETMAAEFAHLQRADSQHAGGKVAAVNARILLKAAFKGVKFSVTSDYNSLRVRWTDGPTNDEVQAIIGRFDIGAADTQTDYFYTVKTAFSELFGGVQYLFTNRNHSPASIAAALLAIYGANGPSVEDHQQGRAWNEVSHGDAYGPDSYNGDQWAWLSQVRRHMEGSKA